MRIITLDRYFGIICSLIIVLITTGCGSGGESGSEGITENNSDSTIQEYNISINRDTTEFALFDEYAFPTFMSHLFGKRFNIPGQDPIDIPFSKVSITNDASEDISNLRLEVGLNGFSQNASQVFNIGAFETKTLELIPDFYEDALFDLDEERAGIIHVKLSDFEGNVLDEYDHGITLLSKNDMVWHIIEDGSDVDLTPFVCSFVTPRNEHVKQAIGEAKEYMYNNAFVGYQNLSGNFQIEVGYENITKVPIDLRSEENLVITINSIENPYENTINNFSIENVYNVWVAGYLSGQNLIHEGATINFTVASPHAEGRYYIKFDNSDPAWDLVENSKVIGYTRSLSQYEIVYYQSKAIYDYLKDLGISYVSSTVSFFENTQAIRYPHEVLETLSGNCIDLTVLFASMLEAIDLNPLIVIIPGHAFVGITSWSDYAIDYTWFEDENYECQNMHFIETTMINSATFSEAWNRGHQELEEYLDLNRIMNIKQWRDLGISPAPIN